MKKLSLKRTYATPQVDFDPETGLFAMKGRVIPENAKEFFGRIIDWMSGFTPDKEIPITVKFSLFYYNTSSSMRIVDIIKKFDELFQKGHDIKIVWEYEEGDDDVMEDGKTYKSLLKIPFEVVKTHDVGE